MPCMCGDIQCSSCGPAQGNWRCPICRAWADDGCEHIDDDGNSIREEFHQQVEAIAKAEIEATENIYREMDELDSAVAEYWASRRKDSE